MRSIERILTLIERNYLNLYGSICGILIKAKNLLMTDVSYHNELSSGDLRK